jgi:hypothetical protein
MCAAVLRVFAHHFLHITATLCLSIDYIIGMNPTAASSSEQPSMAILPVDSLEQTLRDLDVDIDVQSFIEKVISRRVLSTATEQCPLETHPEADASVEPNTQPSVLPLSSTSVSSTQSSPVVTHPADSLSNTAPALVETARQVDPASIPAPTPERRKAMLARKPDSL